MSGPKILVYDIETSPIIAQVWSIWDQNVGLNQIQKDWEVLSWGAKWYNPKSSTVMYQSQENQTEKQVLQGIWKLLDECDVVLTQNGKGFDQRKLNARFVIHGMKPPSSYRHIDMLLVARKQFGFTSHKLEYMADKINKKYKKLKHKEFPGHELWVQCLKGNKKAWKAMKTYNQYDVLSLEELYSRLCPWDSTINRAVYGETGLPVCACGSKQFQKNGYTYSSVGKYQRYTCSSCGSEIKDRRNLLSKVTKDNLKVGVAR